MSIKGKIAGSVALCAALYPAAAMAAEGSTGHGSWLALMLYAINAALFAVVCVRWGGPMVGRYFGSRAHSIRETIQRSNRALADAEAAAHKAAESLRNLAAEKEKLNAGIESGTAFQVKTIREMAAASSQQIRRDAEITAAAAIESARRRIRERLASVTGAVARELVRANFTDQDQNRALDKFLTRLGDEARG